MTLPLVELRLYIAGDAPHSVKALVNLQAICARCSGGTVHVRVIDLLVHPKLARVHQIVVIPTLIREAPLPVRRIVGDLSDTARVVAGLGIHKN
jgi:circadian clock protein KaiB